MSEFHRELEQYLRRNENQNAFELVLNELAVTLVNDRENFVTVLNNAEIPADTSEDDVVLVEKFTQNALANPKLLLGAAMLVNYRNKISNFDGDDELSDAGVKNTYHVLYSNFIGEDEEYSEVLNVTRGLPSLISNAVEGVTGAKKKKEEADRIMLQKVQAEKREKAVLKKQQKDRAKKRMNTALIIGGVSVVVIILGIIIYRTTRKK